MRGKNYIVVAALGLLISGQVAAEPEFTGEAGFEFRSYLHDPAFAGQHGDNLSAYVQPEWFLDWDDGDQRIVFTPFLRLDQGDAERNHFDLREAYWQRSFSAVELSVGLRKVYWGVTESLHLVDVINQTDQVENLDGEDKLGQPMVNLTFLPEWGTVNLYVMPKFRERTFQGRQGRGRAPLVVDEENPIYTSGAGDDHIDLALRWNHYIGDYDIGLSHFSGTSREPSFVPGLAGFGTTPVLRPLYDQIEQTSLDLQATKGDWLWKVELLTRDAELSGRHTAFAGGFEYSRYGVFESAVDVGWLVEYLFDDRAAGMASPFQNDVFIGTRIAFNDVAGTELLAGVIVDADDRGRFTTIEGSRRIGNDWRVTLEGRFISPSGPADPLWSLGEDDYLEIGITRFW